MDAVLSQNDLIDSKSFYEVFKSTKPSKYDLGVDGALKHIEETKMFYNILTEALVKDYDAIKEDFSTSELDRSNDASAKTILGYILKFIEGICKLIDFFIRKIVGIFKKFTIRAKDVYLDNSRFLEKYGKKLHRIESATVEFFGYGMNNDLTMPSMTTSIASQSIYQDAKLIILDGKKVFEDNDTVDEYISKNRFLLLGDEHFISATRFINDKDFQEAIKFKYYGGQKNLTYTVADALNVMHEYSGNVANIRSLTEMTKKQGDSDIRELKILKNMAKNNLAYKDPTAVVKQLSMLSKYRTQAMNDQVYTFEVLMKYIDDSNLQAKSICIKALMEN